MNTFSTLRFLCKRISNFQKNRQNYILIIIGLMVFASCSLPKVSGNKSLEIYPQIKGEYLEKGDEIDEVVRIICENKDESLQKAMKLNRRWFKVNEHPFLSRFFANIKIYKWSDYKRKINFLIISQSKAYSLEDFNQLLIDNKIEITEKNIIELAKSFVVLASGAEYGRRFLGEILGSPAQTSTGERVDEQYGFPSITFLEGKSIKEGYRPLNIEWDAEIKCKINEEVQSWKFTQARNTPRKGEWVKIGQLGVVGVFVNNKPLRSYQNKIALKETEK